MRWYALTEELDLQPLGDCDGDREARTKADELVDFIELISEREMENIIYQYKEDWRNR